MRLVVDSNRIIAGLIKDSATRQLLLNPNFEFVAPEYLLIEIDNHMIEIVRKSKISKDEIKIILDMLIEHLNIIPKTETDLYLGEAKEIIGKIDPDDVPFIALALSIPNDGIWTEDSHYSKQNRIKIWNTRDLLLIHSK